MTTMRIDPDELTATAGTLRSCATETAGLGSGLAGCISCPLPPELEGQVAQVLATADQILQTVLNQLVVDANDLLNRAAIAATDAAAAGTVGIGTHGGGSLYPSAAIIGGSTFDSSIGSPTFMGGVAVIGPPSRPDPLLAAAERLQHTNPAAARDLLGLQSTISSSNHSNIVNWLVPRSHDELESSFGHRLLPSEVSRINDERVRDALGR